MWLKVVMRLFESVTPVPDDKEMVWRGRQINWRGF